MTAVMKPASALMVLREDPAEKDRYLRLFYRGCRPTLFGRIWTRVFAWMAGMGVLPELLEWTVTTK
jgi:hypothetical protein